MTAHIPPDERALIDAAIAAGKVTVVPIGASTAPVYQWQPSGGGKPARLVQVGGADISVRAQGKNFLERMRQANHSRRPDVIAARERLPRVRELAAQGMTRTEIAEAMNLPYGTISKDCQAHGIVTPNPQTVARDRAMAKARELAAQGLPMKRIAKALGREYGVVKKYCADHGIEVVDGHEARKAKRLALIQQAIAGQNEIDIARLAADLGMTRTTVKRYIAQMQASGDTPSIWVAA